ncbi:hypothetical protein ASZ90_005489 [hydrocarbon metagenome]|uniref:DUF3108 domain-containing protein n=1 Tax=hydrocarbon metagenome TaxID=938273 RepID=A0A0W8FUU3_9ZZZZ
MKNIKKLIIVTMLLLTSIYAEEFRTIENNAFCEGEKLTFDVKYGFVTAGIAEMAIQNTRTLAGRDVYHVTFRVNTVPAFDPFFIVRDRYETFLDVEGLFPWRFEQHIREGKYTKDFSAFFDQRRGFAKTTGGTFEIPPNVNDILSAFYITRTFDFSDMKPGDRFHLENFYNDKVYPLDVIYLGKERITVEAGTFDCIIVEPLVVEGGLFKNEGNIIVWLSDDELKIPVKVKTKVIIGSIDSELTAYEGLAGELTSKVK